MNPLRSIRRHLQPKRQRTARMVARMRITEPDPVKLIENFPDVFERTFAPKQTTKEVFEPKPAHEPQ